MELDFSTIQNRLKTLEGIPLFDSMKREDVLDLLRESGAYVHRYRKGEYILLDAENASCICLVLDGIVHMVKENSRGHEALLLYMKRGGSLRGDLRLPQRTDLPRLLPGCPQLHHPLSSLSETSDGHRARRKRKHPVCPKHVCPDM